MCSFVCVKSRDGGGGGAEGEDGRYLGLIPSRRPGCIIKCPTAHPLASGFTFQDGKLW